MMMNFSGKNLNSIVIMVNSPLQGCLKKLGLLKRLSLKSRNVWRVHCIVVLMNQKQALLQLLLHYYTKLSDRNQKIKFANHDE